MTYFHTTDQTILDQMGRAMLHAAEQAELVD